VSTTIWEIAVGDRIRIMREFRDFDGRRVAAGTELVLADKDYFPYDCGHTLTFEGGAVIRLSGDVPDELAVITNADDTYFVQVPR
jgi:hypothetical protein